MFQLTGMNVLIGTAFGMRAPTQPEQPELWDPKQRGKYCIGSRGRKTMDNDWLPAIQETYLGQTLATRRDKWKYETVYIRREMPDGSYYDNYPATCMFTEKELKMSVKLAAENERKYDGPWSCKVKDKKDPRYGMTVDYWLDKRTNLTTYDGPAEHQFGKPLEIKYEHHPFFFTNLSGNIYRTPDRIRKYRDGERVSAETGYFEHCYGPNGMFSRTIGGGNYLTGTVTGFDNVKRRYTLKLDAESSALMRRSEMTVIEDWVSPIDETREAVEKFIEALRMDEKTFTDRFVQNAESIKRVRRVRHSYYNFLDMISTGQVKFSDQQELFEECEGIDYAAVREFISKQVKANEQEKLLGMLEKLRSTVWDDFVTWRACCPFTRMAEFELNRSDWERVQKEKFGFHKSAYAQEKKPRKPKSKAQKQKEEEEIARMTEQRLAEDKARREAEEKKNERMEAMKAEFQSKIYDQYHAEIESIMWSKDLDKLKTRMNELFKVLEKYGLNLKESTIKRFNKAKNITKAMTFAIVLVHPDSAAIDGDETCEAVSLLANQLFVNLRDAHK